MKRTSAAEKKYWDKHSVANHLHELKKADEMILLAPSLAKKIRERSKRKLISIRLAEWEIEKSKQIAKKKKVPYQSLLRHWIDEGLRAEFQK
jgi:predicted DNA binding CopG/RHH family protein